MSSRLSRRRFLAAALGTGAAVALPLDLLRTAQAIASGAGAPPTTYYLKAGSARLATLQALCARIVPTDRSAPGTVTSPGAAEALAYVFIDRLLGAFSLPPAVADNPAIYLRGPFSGRNAYPDYQTGAASSSYPPDSFLTGSQGHYLPLNPLQQLSWQAAIEGPDNALKAAPPGVSRVWAKQVADGLIPAPGPGGLQALYDQGLDAFNSYSESLFATPFAKASTEQQDLMIETAGNVIVGQLPVAPAAARALFPTLVINTFQGTYGLPEYRGQHVNPVWHDIGWEGDTQPLGSSIWDEHLTVPPAGQMSNAGFGQAGVYQPSGYYVEHRPVSTFDDNGLPTPDLGATDVAPLVEALRARGAIKQIGVAP
ncbi:MAG TPA: gluconate 2-dehydrogenase subunit 3 family protein [Acidimicrobiales bacterium]|nr:gluconate 2-dehydrogenase subunit 3 family protein [Acidimicrobiales bacterium]